MTVRKNKLIIGIGVLALFGTGVGSGMFVQRRYETAVAAAAIEPFRNLAKTFSGDGGENGPAPSIEHWFYPDAIENGRGQGSSFAVNGKTVAPATEYLMFATGDDYEVVVDYYGKKLGFAAAAEFGTSGMTNTTSTEAGFQLALANGKKPDANRENRPISVLCLRQTCASYSVVAFITRAENEGHTHVILLYDPKIVDSKSSDESKS